MVARLIHGSLVMGCLAFAAVLFFIIVPQRAEQGIAPLPPVATNVLMGVSLAASALALLMRRRVPRRNTNESADLFWTAALRPALLSWSPAEAGGLIGLVAFMIAGSTYTLVVAGVAVVVLVSLYPGRLERA